MALPTQKHTKSRTRKRKPSLALKKACFSNCPKCSKPVLPHHACTFCGTYAGKEVLKISAKGRSASGGKSKSKKQENKETKKQQSK